MGKVIPDRKPKPVLSVILVDGSLHSVECTNHHSAVEDARRIVAEGFQQGNGWWSPAQIKRVLFA